MKENEFYKSQLILSKGEARLVPPNSNYPNSICSLVLTESNFYVLERRFNGSYEEYFNIYVKQLIRIELFKPNRGSGLKAAFFIILALLSGVFYFETPENRDYLEIDYYDENGDKNRIIFKELDSDIKDLVKNYNKSLNHQLS